MLIHYGENEFKCSPAMAIIACKILHFCDYWNIPFAIRYVTDSEIVLLTDTKPDEKQNEWTEQKKCKFRYEFTRDYSDLKLTKYPLCEIKPNEIRIVVNPTININKFHKD